jgi:hypothetical protein
MKYLAAALGAACVMGGAGAALAETSDSVVSQSDANKREAIMLRIPASIDASDPAQVIALRSKAIRQIERVCNPGDRLNADMSPDFQCRREMAANLELALQRRANGG